MPIGKNAGVAVYWDGTLAFIMLKVTKGGLQKGLSEHLDAKVRVLTDVEGMDFRDEYIHPTEVVVESDDPDMISIAELIRVSIY